MSHIQQQRDLFAKNKQTIKSLLNWNSDNNSEYEWLQYSKGLEYLEANFPKHAIDMLEQNAMYWKWWINHWNLRDAELVPTIKSRSDFSLNKYIHMHSVGVFTKYPSYTIMEESYAKMIGEFNDSKNGSHV